MEEELSESETVEETDEDEEIVISGVGTDEDCNEEETVSGSSEKDGKIKPLVMVVTVDETTVGSMFEDKSVEVGAIFGTTNDGILIGTSLTSG